MAKKQMLINTVQDQECRIAILDDGQLEELYIERASSASQVGNIYKGRVTNVESSIQAAFVDFGGNKNGFLHISDVHPQYFPGGKKKAVEAVGNKKPRRERPPIQDCLRRGTEVVVQMTKEGIGTKGPTLSTYLSIPGRLLVMMPGMTRLGVSRKVEDPDARAKARDALNELKLPDDMGFIVRTAGIGHAKRDLQRDLNYLSRLWKSINQRIKKSKAPAELYQESNLVIRTIRDVYNSDISRIVCDDQDVARSVREFLRMSVPRTRHTIEVYTGKEGLFYEFGVEEEIQEIYSRRVEMDSGGSLVLDQTEALVAIDVNSGKFKDHSDAETTALKINQEAAKEILRQLRLRDLGGVIVIDFIDMRADRNRKKVEKIVREGLKDDRAKTKMLRMSSFGLMELTRQRVRPSLKHSMFRQCASCEGLGLIQSEESLALAVLRDLQRATADDDITRVEVTVRPDVAYHLANHQRHQIARMEKNSSTRIIIQADDAVQGDEVQFVCKNSRGSVVSWDRDGKSRRNSQNIQTMNLKEYEKAQAMKEESAESDSAKDEPPHTDTQEKDSSDQEETGSQSDRKKRRRGRRGGRKHRAEDRESDQQDQKDSSGKEQKQEGKQDKSDSGDQKDQQEDKKRSSRRRRRSKRKGEPRSDQQDQQKEETSDSRDTDPSDKQQKSEQKPDQKSDQGQKDNDEQPEKDGSRRSRRRRRRPRKSESDQAQQEKADQTKSDQPEEQAEESKEKPIEKPEPQPGPDQDSSRRRRRRRSKPADEAKDKQKSASEAPSRGQAEPKPKAQQDQDDDKRSKRRVPRKSRQARKESTRQDDAQDKKPKRTRRKKSKTSAKSSKTETAEPDQQAADEQDSGAMPRRVKRSEVKKAAKKATRKTAKKAAKKTTKKTAKKKTAKKKTAKKKTARKKAAKKSSDSDE